LASLVKEFCSLAERSVYALRADNWVIESSDGLFI